MENAVYRKSLAAIKCAAEYKGVGKVNESKQNYDWQNELSSRIIHCQESRMKEGFKWKLPLLLPSSLHYRYNLGHSKYRPNDIVSNVRLYS